MMHSTELASSRIVPDNKETSVERYRNGDSSTTLYQSVYGNGQGLDPDRSHLRDYWRVIRKHIWLVIGMSVLLPTIVAIYLVRKPDIYESQARIQVDLES